MDLEQMSLVIIQAMKDRKVSSKELSGILGVNERTIRNHRSGRCTVVQYMNLLRALDLSVSVTAAQDQVMEIKGSFVITNKTGLVSSGEGAVADLAKFDLRSHALKKALVEPVEGWRNKLKKDK